MGCISSSPPVQIKKLTRLPSQFHSFSQGSLNRFSYKNTPSSTRDKNRKKLNKVQFINQNENIQPNQNVVLSTQQITVQDKSMLDDILLKSCIFYKLSPAERKQVIDRFVIYYSAFDEKQNSVNANRENNTYDDSNQYLFKKNDIGTLFFVIKSGTVEVQLEGEKQVKKKVLQKGDFFGDIALLYKTGRSASVKCLSKCTFLCLSTYLFKQILQTIVEKTVESNKIRIQRVKLFQYLTPKQKNKLANSIIVLKYQKNDIIFQQGQQSYAFFIIISGKVRIQIKNKSPIQLKPGQYFGQSSFQQNSKRSGTAICQQKAELISITKKILNRVLKNESKEFYFYSILKWSLKRNFMFNQFSSSAIQKLLKQSDIINFQDGHELSKQDDKVKKIYIPLEGKINLFEVGEIINTEYLAEIQKDKKHIPKNQHTLYKNQQGHVCVIDINKILAILNKNLIKIQNIDPQALQQMNKQINFKKGVHSSSQHRIKNTKPILGTKQNKQIVKLQNLKIIKKIGDGQFGSIYRVKNILSSNLYALKTFNKIQVDEYKMRHFIKQQLQIMKFLKNPSFQFHSFAPSKIIQFIASYQTSYQTQQYILILMQLIEGKDFFDTMIQIGWLNSQLVRFFFASFVLVIEYLHANEIIYRDIKPQNAVVQPSGYLKIIDFGTARKLTVQNKFKSFTIVGTPHYMAPEIIAGKGYSFEADIWSLGILLYQMSCGRFPFGQKIQQPLQIYNQVIKPHSNIIYPKQFQQKSLKRLIDRLLVKDPSMRELQDFQQIKQSEFYQNFNWQRFISKQLKSPFKPYINSSKRQLELDQQQQSQQQYQKRIKRFIFQIPVILIKGDKLLITVEKDKNEQYGHQQTQSKWEQQWVCQIRQLGLVLLLIQRDMQLSCIKQVYNRY